MLNTPFSPWPSFSNEEADAVRDVILSNKVNYWTGQECREFEKEFAVWSATQYAVAVANGTVALDLAFKALKNRRRGMKSLSPPERFWPRCPVSLTLERFRFSLDVDRESQKY